MVKGKKKKKKNFSTNIKNLKAIASRFKGMFDDVPKYRILLAFSIKAQSTHVWQVYIKRSVGCKHQMKESARQTLSCETPQIIPRKGFVELHCLTRATLNNTVHCTQTVFFEFY